MKYKIISADTIKNLIDFLDEIQFDAAKLNTTDAHHQVNFCNWAINELLNSYNVMTASDLKGGKKKPKKKSRQDYVDETFIDWNLPEMTDEEYEKLVDQFDDFLRAWEKNYLKDNPKKKPKNKRKPKKESKSKKPYVPPFEDVAEYMSLEEIKEFLLDDPELTDEERFDLYYEEREREIEKKNSMSYDELLRKSGIKPAGWKPKKK